MPPGIKEDLTVPIALRRCWVAVHRHFHMSNIQRSNGTHASDVFHGQANK